MSTTLTLDGSTLTLPTANQTSWDRSLNATITALNTRLNATSKVFNVRGSGYGAVGDGATDDTAAIQAALTAAAAAGGEVFFPPGTYRYTATLYAWGATNLRGVGDSSVLKPDFSASTWVTIALGAKPGAPADASGAAWGGTMSDLKFDCSTNPTNPGQIINVFRADGYTFERLFFSQPRTTCIKGSNNGAYASTSLLRRNGRYRNNRIYSSTALAADPMEGLSVSDTAAGDWANSYAFVIEGNVIEGCGDDPIAVHGDVENVIIRGNRAKSIDGRIYVSHARKVVVSENVLTHTVEGGWYVNVSSDEFTDRGQCQDVTVRGNVITTPAVAGPNSAYAIRVRGVAGSVVEGNTIVNSLTGTLSGGLITLTGVEIGGTTTPSFSPSNSVVRGNRLAAASIQFSSTGELNSSCAHNRLDAGKITIIRPGSYGPNEIVPHASELKIYDSETRHVRPDWTYDFFLTLPASGTWTAALANALTTVTIDRRYQILGYRFRISGTISSGWIDIKSQVSGANLSVMTFQPTSAGAQEIFVQPSGAAIAVQTASTPVGMIGGCNNAVGASGLKLSVEVYGAYVNE